MDTKYWHGTLLALIILTVNIDADDKPTCQPGDFHYEYTECDSDGGRWRVSVPTPGLCVGGAPNPPVRGQGCTFVCQPGEYIDIQGDQECHMCPAGTYSLGGGELFEDWDELPPGFSSETESFSAPRLASRYFSKKADISKDDRSNCSQSGWQLKGKYIASMPDECQASLIYSANLVKPGYVRFTYQFTDEAIFHFMVKNDQCQTVSDRDSNKWPKQTEDGEWNTITMDLKSGLNLLHWTTLGMSRESSYRKPILIKSIEVIGLAYTSECTKCKNGTHSEAGASSCVECPVNTYSEKGDAECKSCDTDTTYSEIGSASCLPKPLCTEDNYFEYNSPCDNTNQTRKMYKWVDPKVCRDDLEGAAQLPASGQPEACPPCNPGMEYVDGVCRFCGDNHFSSGDGPCTECAPSTAPEYGLELKWWSNLPAEANISATCLSMNDRGCTSKNGWVNALDNIHSGKGHADDAYLVLTLELGGFRGNEQFINGRSAKIAEISFVFELECSADCTFFFMMQTPSNPTSIIETWDGTQPKQKYTYTITKKEAVMFTWAFQKQGWEDDNPIDFSRTFNLKDDFAKIHSISVSNTLQGGAQKCKSCPKGSTNQGCIPCPPGQYINPNTTRCVQCPADTVLHGENPWGIESCVHCGSGLKAYQNVKCQTNCKFSAPDGRDYDFTTLAGVHGATGARLFTASGTQYYHYFNFSLCTNEKYPVVECRDNITYGLSGVNDTREMKADSSERVQAMICRSTLIPPRDGEEADGIMAAQPVSLGDILVNITNNASSTHRKIIELMQQEGFSTDGISSDMFNSPRFWDHHGCQAVKFAHVHRGDRHDSAMDVHFSYISETPTSACREGRSTIVTLRCDMTQKGIGVIDVPPKCPDGTCDGCVFHFLWRTIKACPICKKTDYTEVKGECIRGEQVIHYYPPTHCVLMSGNEAYTHLKKCSILPFWAQIGIGMIIGFGLLLFTLVIYCWKKNRKLEYKYSKLVHSGGKDGELPEVETCGMDEEDDDEQFDAVDFKESKGKKFFNKIKNMAKKDGNHLSFTFDLEELSPDKEEVWDYSY